ncbi:MAG: hypothetical protein AMXMBFR51_20810 [Ignavibacteriota bacterium]
MNLQAEIKNKGLKQKWIANKAGITTTHLSLVLNKKRNPSKQLLEKIKMILEGKEL